MANADKRTVSTDALETLGTIIGPNERRDAIHLAVLPVKCGPERLYRAERISIENGVAVADMGGLGIVDPFIEETHINPGEFFWMVLKPRIIKSLRHVWRHDAFPAPEDNLLEAAAAEEAKKGKVDDAMKQIDALAAQLDVDSGQDLIAAAERYIDHGDYLSEGGRWEGTYLPESFWDLFETVTGRQVPNNSRESFFSCSC